MDAYFNTAPQPTTKRRVDVDGPDFYPTPHWATVVLLDHEPFEGGIWEPACGDGAMSRAIEEFGYDVESTDLHDRGFGQGGIDFLDTKRKADNVVTNPPYHSAEKFALAGLANARHKIALLLRLSFLEGVQRNSGLFTYFPPRRIWVFSERITFYPKGAKRKGSGTTAYAWFVWDNQDDGPCELRWLPPGYKKKYPDPEPAFAA